MPGLRRFARFWLSRRPGLKPRLLRLLRPRLLKPGLKPRLMRLE